MFTVTIKKSIRSKKRIIKKAKTELEALMLQNAALQEGLLAEYREDQKIEPVVKPKPKANTPCAVVSYSRDFVMFIDGKEIITDYEDTQDVIQFGYDQGGFARCHVEYKQPRVKEFTNTVEAATYLNKLEAKGYYSVLKLRA